MDLHERVTRASGFQWDGGSRDKSWIRHRVSVGESEEAFFNQPVLLAEDAGHAADEARSFLLGRTSRGRLFTVASTSRGDLIRVVSARDMSGRERREYPRHA